MMPDNKNQLVGGLLFVGLALLGFSVYFSFFKDSTSQETRLARVEQQTGKIFILHANYTQKEAVEKRANLVNLDSVETLDTGEALISFESAYRVRLFNNALVTLEKVQTEQGFQVVLIIKRGNLKVENFGREGELMIAKNGDRVAASDYNDSSLSQEAVAPATSPPTNLPEINNSLSEEEISGVVANHRESFRKCFTQLLQKDPTVKGEVSLGFTIENNGKLSVAEVTSSQMSNQALNPDFKKCLLEVVKRIEFRPFSGPPISTLFPLKFD